MVKRGKILAVWLAVAAVLFLGGCSGKSTSAGAGALETTVVETTAGEVDAGVTAAMAPAASAETEIKNESEETDTDALKAEGPGAELRAADTAESGDKDIEAFAELIQEAVADKDMEALADLSAFPLQLETGDGDKLAFEDRDEFLKQNPDLIFGDDLMVAVAGIDTATLEPETDGVTMGEEAPSIHYVKMKDETYRITVIRE